MPDHRHGNAEAQGLNAATVFSAALIGEFISLGVTDIVLSPGSRSQALALAAAAWEKAGKVHLRVRIDERVAGFLALGLAVETRTPVLLITTSGTAVANLHPAVLEAHHSGVPLVLLTADRPPELRGIGSNQTTDQLGIFGTAVSWVRDVEAPHTTPGAVSGSGAAAQQLAAEAYSAAMGHSAAAGNASAGPVQLNLAFREPLSGPAGELPELRTKAGEAASAPHGSKPAVAAPHVTMLGRAANTVVIAGHGAGADAESFARALGVPLLAEISSGSRFGPNLVGAYRQLLGDPEFGGRIERAIVFGHPTLSREIPALLQREGVKVHVVQGRVFEAYNPGHRAVGIHAAVAVTSAAVMSAADMSAAVTSDPETDVETGAGSDIRADADRAARDWLGGWVHASRRLLETPVAPARPELSLAREQLDVFREPVTRGMLVEAVWRTTWPHDRLVLGASRLIRIADATVPGKKISAHANRGLAGIDGTIATAIGVALASQSSPTSAAAGITRVLLGDLATLYDVGALLFGVGEVRPRIQIIVGNDGGGTIFDDLEVAKTAPETEFARVLYTPQKIDFAALAAAYGWHYLSATNRGELDEALAATERPTLIEVALPR